MADEIIDVACCVFPDGTTFWSDEPAQVPKITELWRGSDSGKAIPEGCMGGVVYVRMPRSKYIAIGAHFPDPIAQGLAAA